MHISCFYIEHKNSLKAKTSQNLENVQVGTMKVRKIPFWIESGSKQLRIGK